MNTKLKKLLALVLMACMLLSVTAVAFAEGTADAAQCWNIMLVLDGSRSLSSGVNGVATDPQGLRYEAIDSFIDTLQDKGQYVGAIVFMANPGTGTSEQEMYKGIRLDTWKDGPVSIENNKATLKNQIRNADLSTSESGNVGETDIGTALYWAEKRLAQAHEENGLPCALFLFTDGLNALTNPGPQRQSEQNMSDATAALKADGVSVCGVFLNTSKKSIDSTQVRDIVCDANGISSGDLDLGNYFIEINNASDCANSTDKFMEMLGFSFGNQEVDTITYSCDRSFRIPGTGVEEVNIRVRTLTGDTLPKGMKISITQPNGTEISGALAAAICSSGRTYQIYKISNPEAGTWNVHIELPEDNKILVDYNPIFSVYVESGFDTNPETEKLHANMNAEIDCFLTKDGQRVTEEKDYREYSCILEVTNATSGEVKNYDVPKNGNGEFKINVPLDYGIYDVRTVFSCNQISAESSKTTWFLDNTAPTAGTSDTPLTFSILTPSGVSKDISSYYDDLEDGKDLTLSLIGEDNSGLELNGNELRINVFKAKSGEYTFRATDSQGSSVDFKIELKNVTIRNLLILVVALIIIALVVLLIIRKRNSYIPEGVCTVEFDVEAEDDRGREKEVTINAELTPPGRGTKRNTNLYDMLNADMMRQAGSIRGICDEEDISFRAVERFVDSIEPELRKVKVMCTVESLRSKGKVAKVKVKFGRINTSLFNNAVKLTPCGKAVSFGYYLRDVDSDEGEDFTFSNDDNDGYVSGAYSDSSGFDDYDSGYSESSSSSIDDF